MSIAEGVTGNAVFLGLLSLGGVKLSPVAWITAGSGVAFVLLLAIDILRTRAAAALSATASPPLQALPDNPPRTVDSQRRANERFPDVVAYRASIQLGSMVISSGSRSVTFTIVVQRWKGAKPTADTMKVREINLGGIVLVNPFEIDCTGPAPSVLGDIGRWGVYSADCDKDEKFTDSQAWTIQQDVRHEAAEQLKQKVGQGMSRLIVRCSLGNLRLVLATDAVVWP